MTAFAFSVSNPVYLALAAAGIGVGHLARPARRGVKGFVIAALVLLAARVVVACVFPNPGTTVLVALPRLPLVGDAVTAEGLGEAFAEGLRFVVVLIAFGAANASLDVAAAIRSVPPALRDAGLVCAIGLSFVPGLAATVRDVRDAQALRGRRGLRAIAPSLVVPVLGLSLERAFSVAESMDARGYGRRPVTRLHHWRPGPRDLLLASMSIGLTIVATALARPSAWTAYPVITLPVVSPAAALLALAPGATLALR